MENKVSLLMPARMKKDKNIKPMSKIIYMEICALSLKYGYCYASNTYFAEQYDKSVTQISGYIAELSEGGYISVEAQVQSEGKTRKIRVLSQDDTPIHENVNSPSENREELLSKTRTAIHENENSYSRKREPEDVVEDVTEDEKENTATQLKENTADSGDVPSLSSTDTAPKDPELVDWDRVHFENIYSTYPEIKRNLTKKEFKALWKDTDIKSEYPLIMSVIVDLVTYHEQYMPNMKRFFQEKIYKSKSVCINSEFTEDGEKEKWRLDHMTDEEWRNELDDALGGLGL